MIYDESNIRRLFKQLCSEDEIGFLILPLVGVHHVSFGPDNIESVRIDFKGNIYVLPKRYHTKLDDLSTYKTYKYNVTLDDKLYYVFTPIKRFEPDYQKLICGNAIGISDEAKQVICDLSKYKHIQDANMARSDYMLQALYTDSPIREHVAEFMEVPLRMVPMDLLKEVHKDSLLYIENYIKF